MRPSGGMQVVRDAPPHRWIPGSVSASQKTAAISQSPPGGRLLIITRLDYRREPNQRVHHEARHLAPLFAETTVLFQARGTSDPSWWSYFRSILWLRTASWTEGRVTFVEVDPFWNPPWGGKIRYLGFLSQFLFDPLSLMLGYLFRIRRTFDVVLAVGPHAGAVGYLLKRLGLARLVVYDDIDYEPGLQLRRFRVRYTAWMERFFMARADLRVTVGDALAELRRSQGVGELSVIPNGVTYEIFCVAQSKKTHPPTIIYTGNLARGYSGLEVAIRSLSKIARTCPDIRLLIVGSGEPREECALRSLIRDLGVGERVRMVGECRYEELPEYLGQADLGWAAFPPNDSRQYAFPYKVIEYMAAGLAVLGTMGSQTARLIQRYNCGVATPYDAGAVAEAAVALLEDRRRLAEYARNGAREAAAYDWGKLLAQQRELILSRLGR